MIPAPYASTVKAEHDARVAALTKVDVALLKSVAAQLGIPGGRKWSEFGYVEVCALHRHAVELWPIPPKREVVWVADDSPEGIALLARMDALAL